MSEVHVDIELPMLLKDVLGDSSFSVTASNLRGAFEQIVKNYPQLGVHLFSESGELRQHVLCFHNEKNTRWLDNLDVPVAAGDRLLFMQAVSGG